MDSLLKNILKDTLIVQTYFIGEITFFFSVSLQRSKSAEKFVSFDQVNFKRINFNSDHQKEKRIGEFRRQVVKIPILVLMFRQHGHGD